MGDGQTCPDVCRSMKLSPTESTIIKNAEQIKHSLQHATAVCVMQVSYSRSKLVQKIGEIIVIICKR
jgi:hypothetical protein